MVLAAGLGLRMRPYTDRLPKPLIPVCGKPLIDWTLDRFAAAGVERAVVNVHHRADALEAHLKRRTRPSIAISDERALLLETGGGLNKARPLLGEAPVLCTNTDAILVDGETEPCASLAGAWRDETMDALLLLTPISRASGYDGAGDFDLASDGRVSWRAGAAAPYVYTGLQIIRPSLLDGAPEGPFSMRLLWDKAQARGRMRAIVHDAPWMHVGDPQGLALAEAFFDKMRHGAAGSPQFS
jgi:MurNAc alpha-1-phosphate uridylyltransferase